MRRSKILAKLRAGQVARLCCLGHYVPFFVKVAAANKYDGIWVDAEHRAFEPREAQALFAFHHLFDIDCLWRPATAEMTGLYRLLEDGAAGLMIPMVSTPEKARNLVESTKFPPLGNRGIDAAGLDIAFTPSDKPVYCEFANRETCLMVQIETPEAVSNAEAIGAIPGVDVLFIGPGDLSHRLGVPMDMANPKLAAAQKQVAQAARNTGKAWGRPVLSPQDAKDLVEAGAQVLVMGGEFAAVSQYLKDSSDHLDRAISGKPAAKKKAAAPAAAIP